MKAGPSVIITVLVNGQRDGSSIEHQGKSVSGWERRRRGYEMRHGRLRLANQSA